MMNRRFSNKLIVAFLLLVVSLTIPLLVEANNEAHGIWGVGVQIGMAELASNQNMPPDFIIQSLTYARDLAVASGCIPTREIDQLISAMRSTRDSRNLYSRISTYRQSLGRSVIDNCNCDTGTGGDTQDTKCITISAKKGWQEFSIPLKYSHIKSITGGWNVHYAHALVGPEGYQGALEQRMTKQYGNLKYIKDLPFSALLLRADSYGKIYWIKSQNSDIKFKGERLQFRINDADSSLSDNKGELKICFSR
jgi:hypothetical protein